MDNAAEDGFSSSQIECPQPTYAMDALPQNSMRRLEHRLFHHYITQIAPMSERYDRPAETNIFWTQDIPRLSFAFDAVLSGVLGKWVPQIFRKLIRSYQNFGCLSVNNDTG